MTNDERRALIDRYAAGGGEVLASLEGFPPEGITAHPIPGKWSAREIVHHLADSEAVSVIRIRRLLAELHPVIAGYDQERFAVALRYNERDHAPALALFLGLRAATTPLLRSLGDADWASRGWHPASGLYTAEGWLEIYAAHAHGHAAQIRRLREALRAG